MPENGTGERERLVLAAAVALDTPCQLDLIAATAGLEQQDVAEALEQLELRGLVASEPPNRFVIAGQVEAGLLPGASLTMAHARAAGELLRRGAADADVCRHLLASPGGGNPRHVEVLLRQAASCRSEGDLESAVALTRRALLEPPPEQQLCVILLELADLLLSCGQHEEALDIARRARDRRRSAAQRADATVLMARALEGMGNHERAALAIGDELENPTVDREAGVALRHELLRQGASNATALHLWSQHASHDLDNDGDLPPAQISLQLLPKTQQAMRDGTPATEAVTITLQHLARLRPTQYDLHGILSAAWLLIRADEPNHLTRLLTAARPALGAPAFASLTALEGIAALRFSCVDTAIDLLERALRIGRRHEDAVAVDMSTAFLAHALFEADEQLRLERLLARRDPFQSRLSSPWKSIRRIAQARADLVASAPEPALAALMRVEEEKQSLGMLNPAGFHHSEPLVEALLTLGRQNDAARYAELNLARAGAWGAPITLALAESTCATCAHPDRARELHERALSRLASMPPNTTQARLRLAIAKFQLERNQRARAERHLREALDIATRTSARRLATELLRNLGHKPRRTAIFGIESLTRSDLAELDSERHHGSPTGPEL
jgi:tetratricopeptide (TPR) repeat protein